MKTKSYEKDIDSFQKKNDPEYRQKLFKGRIEIFEQQAEAASAHDKTVIKAEFEALLKREKQEFEKVVSVKEKSEGYYKNVVQYLKSKNQEMKETIL
jgi:hypothetical protein